MYLRTVRQSLLVAIHSKLLHKTCLRIELGNSIDWVIVTTKNYSKIMLIGKEKRAHLLFIGRNIDLVTSNIFYIKHFRTQLKKKELICNNEKSLKKKNYNKFNEISHTFLHLSPYFTDKLKQDPNNYIFIIIICLHRTRNNSIF